MRRFLVFAALLSCLIDAASAQVVPTATGIVTMDILPSRVELRPGETQTSTAWLNATIQCESGYAPTSQVTVRPAPNSLDDDDGQARWIVDPSSVALEFQANGPRFEAKQVVNITVRAADTATLGSGTIEFEVVWPGSGIPSNDCGMFGSSWRLENDPHIDVTLHPRNESWAERGFVDAGLGTVPTSTNSSLVVVEGGAITGESRVPGEAFWSLGIVFGLFASSAVYSWRRR